MKNCNLPPFKAFVLQNFPFIEEDFDALTYYEILCKVIEYLNNMINNVNSINNHIGEIDNSIIDLYNKLNDLKTYVENMNFQEEVDNKIDEMIESGEFTELLQSFNIHPTLKFQKVGTLKYENGTRYETPLTGKYYWGQGMTIVNDVIYQSFVTGNETSQMVRKISLTTGEVLQEKMLNIGHCDSIGKNETTEKLFFCNGKSVLVTDYNLNVITSLDFTNLVNYTGFYFDYDNQTNKYIYGNQNNFNYVELDNSYNITIGDHFSFNNLNNQSQSGCVDNGSIYILYSNPNRIQRISTTGVDLGIYYIDEIVEGFPVNETEGITMYNNELYIVSTQYFQALDMYAWTMYFKTKLNSNIDLLHETFYYPATVNIYVNPNGTTWNSNGTQNNPFTEISQAITFIKNSNYNANNNKKILLSAGNYQPIYADNINNFHFTSVNGDSIMNYVRIYNSTNIIFEKIIFAPETRTLSRTTGVIQDCSDIKFIRCLFDENLEAPFYTVNDSTISKFSSLTHNDYTDANIESGDVVFFDLHFSILNCGIPIVGAKKDTYSKITDGLYLCKPGNYLPTNDITPTLDYSDIKEIIDTNHLSKIDLIFQDNEIESCQASLTLNFNSQFDDEDYFYYANFEIDTDSNEIENNGYKISKDDYAITSYSANGKRYKSLVGY